MDRSGVLTVMASFPFEKWVYLHHTKFCMELWASGWEIKTKFIHPTTASWAKKCWGVAWDVVAVMVMCWQCQWAAQGRDGWKGEWGSLHGTCLPATRVQQVLSPGTVYSTNHCMDFDKIRSWRDTVKLSHVCWLVWISALHNKKSFKQKL
jgi:hypothetical protein